MEHYSQQIAMHKNLSDKSAKLVPFPDEYYAKHEERITKQVENIKDRRKSRLPAKTLFKHEAG